MAEILCPICQRPNEDNAARCWYCQAVLPENEKPAAGGNTDWLNNLRDESLSDEGPADYTPITPLDGDENSPDEVPDWLARIRTREKLEKESEPEPSIETPVDNENDLPDWLKEIKAGNSGQIREVETPAILESTESAVESPPYENPKPALTVGDESADDTQEWLNQLAAWKPAATEASEIQAKPPVDPGEPPANQPTDLDEFSDLEKWLADQNTNIPEDKLAEPEAEPLLPVELDPLSGWQKLIPEKPVLPLEPHSETLMEPSAPSQELEPEEQPGQGNAFQPEPAEPRPAKMGTLDFSEEEKNQIAAALPTDNLDAQSDLHLLNGESEAFLEPGSDESQKSQPATPFLTGEPSEWSAKTTSQPFLDVDPDFQDALNNLESQPSEKVELPEWLQAIRSEGATSIPQTQPQPKMAGGQQGLLAGIQDTLESAHLEKEFKKPVSYSSTLKVSERQTLNATLLAGLLSEKEEEVEVEVEKTNHVRRVLWRLAIALVLIGTLVVSNLYFSAFALKPTLFPPELVASYNAVNAIPAEKPVLVVADFEPALSGELNWTGRTMFEHMMLRDLQLVLLSVQPAGSALLVDQLHTANRFVPGYDLATRTTNLGYLAGGNTGLQMAAVDLRTVLPYTQNLTPAWELPTLQTVQQFSDFGAVIVITDQPESTRAWVEQVQPQLKDVPLLFVASAQAAPLIHPYYQSGQVTGFMAGFNGSLAYEQIMQQNGVTSQNIASYQGLMLIITLIIFAGGLASIIRPASAQRKG